jgi:hypothetical protein
MIRGSVSKGWLHQEGRFSFGREYYEDPELRRNMDLEIEAFLARRFPDAPLYNMESNLVQPEYLPGDAVYIGAIQPNLILGHLLGCEYVFPENADSEIKGKPWAAFPAVSPATLRETLPRPADLLDYPLIHEYDRQIDGFMQGAHRESVIPPFFWDRSGRATIHGFITTSFKFAGEQIFITAFENPDLAAALHEWLLQAYTILITHFAEKADLPVTGIHIGECTGAMISADQFEFLVLPYVKKIGKTFGNIRLHTCGYSDHLLEKISGIPDLYSIDTGSDTSVRKIRTLLGQELMIETAPPMELMIKGSPVDKILNWLQKNVEENKGGPMRLSYHLEPGYNLDNILALHQEGIRLGIAQPGRPALYPHTT